MAAKKSNTDRGTTSKCFKSDVIVVAGGVSFEVNFFPPRKSTNDMKLESTCPACYAADPLSEPIKTEVFHHCGRGIAAHGPFKYGDLVRATKDDDGDLRVIGTVEEVKAVRGIDDDPDNEDVADNTFHLVAHPAADVENSTYPLGTPYIMRPVPGKPTAIFPFFQELVGNDGRYTVGKGKAAKQMVLIGEVTLKGNRKLMQLRTWNGQLVCQELVRPEDLHEFEPVATKKDARFADLVTASLENCEEDFDPENFENEARKRLAAFREMRLADSTASVTVMPTRAAVPVAQDDDALLLQLQASVAAVSKAKAGKKAS